MIARPFETLIVALTLTSAFAPAIAAPVSGQGTWESELKARDINSDGVVDAYYDSALNLTWLADANFAKTSGFVTTSDLGSAYVGSMAWSTANTWASGLDVFGVTGWRLPGSSMQGLPPGCGSTTDNFGCSVTPDPSFSEMAHMFYVTLGNTAAGLTNTGLFANLQTNLAYDTGTFVQAGRPFAFRFDFSNGSATLAGELASVPGYAWAVHDGDIAAAVPEPQTYALMLVGLGALALAARRRNRRLSTAA